VLGEIVAEHLEHRLGLKIGRSLGLGGTALVYQSLVSGDIGLYPEDTGSVQTEILKESPAQDAAAALNRVRDEMKRIAQVTVLDPVGAENSWAVIVQKDGLATLTAAADAKDGWKLGVTRDFDERTDGLATLDQYHLPMSAPHRVTDPASLYAAFAAGELTMVVGDPTDGLAARHNDWKILADDKKIFSPYPICLMVRADLLLSDPKIQPALAELSGKMTNDALRKLDAEVDVDHKKLADVAAEFLLRAGLK
jgi:glycine betaine/choline ABC-type transport system substrate-binding protein